MRVYRLSVIVIYYNIIVTRGTDYHDNELVIYRHFKALQVYMTSVKFDFKVYTDLSF